MESTCNSLEGRVYSGEGELSFPTSISIDSDDAVYVAEGRNHRVSVFTREGTFLTSFGSKGDGPGQFNTPREITVDKNGVIYVSDSVLCHTISADYACMTQKSQS